MPARRPPRIFGLLGLAAALTLSACFWEASPAKLYKQIQEGHAAKALSTLEQRLEKSPQDPTLNALALYATLTRCEKACPPASFKSIGTYLTYAKAPVKIDDQTLLNPLTVLTQAAPAIAQLPNQPAPLLALLAVTPPSVQTQVQDALFAAPLALLREHKPVQAGTMLQTFSTDAAIAQAPRAWAQLVHGLATANPASVAAALVTLRTFPTAEPTVSPLPTTGLQLLPHLLITGHPSGTVAAAQAFSPTLAGFQIPNLLTPAALKPIAAEVNTLRTAEKNEAASLQLANLSLQLNPAQPDLWAEFLPKATAYIQKQGPAAEAQPMAHLTLTALSPQQQQQVVTQLFTLVEQLSKANQPVAPLLTQLSTLQLTGAIRTKLEKLIQSSLEVAIANQNLPEVIAYAQFQPQLAQANRAGITPLIVNAIRQDLQNQQFQKASEHTQLLTRLGISFNLNTLMLQELDKSFESLKIRQQLSATTPAILLQPLAAVQIDLGPLFDYLKTIYFVNDPAQLNVPLRNLVAGAQGSWGTATAMARLASAFDPTDFPPEAQKDYLVRAIQTALVNDELLTPTQQLTTATQLQALYPSLALSPVVEAALARVTTAEESKDLWQSASAKIHQVITATRPQFAALMRGITAWQAGNRTLAAQHFATITQATYAKQLQPYFDDLQTQLQATEGTYLAATGTLPTVLVRVTAPALHGDTSGSLAALSLSFTNALGTLPGSGLSPDFATTQQATLSTPLNFGQNAVLLSAEARKLAAAPNPFATTFGNLSTATFENGNLTFPQLSGAAPVTFTRLSANPEAILWPTGRWLFSRPLATVPGTETLLPPGSLLTLETDLTASPDGTYTATGSLWHPALSQPQEVKGTFSAATGLTTLSYKAPLAQGGMAKVEMRCQLLPGSGTCGVHVQGLSRKLFATLITGTQTKESRTALTHLIATTAPAAPPTALMARLTQAPTSTPAARAAAKLKFVTSLSPVAAEESPTTVSQTTPGATTVSPTMAQEEPTAANPIPHSPSSTAPASSTLPPSFHGLTSAAPATPFTKAPPSELLPAPKL